jgi:TolA-binding protein
MAERLLEDKKYDAAINEFQTIVDKEPFSELGRFALLKIAQIQHIYLGRAHDAQLSYELLAKRTKDPSQLIEIDKALASLAFDNLEEFELAISIYQRLLEKNIKDSEAALFTFKIGRSYFFLNRFDDAIRTFESIQEKYPNMEFAKKASLEIANALSAKGDCKGAIKLYEKLAADSDKDTHSLAVFADAACQEELDNLEKAYDLLSSIKKTYPVPSVVEMKMNKIKRRKIMRRR